MSNKDFMQMREQQAAAHMLMVEFVKNNADDVAKALEPLVTIWGEVTYMGLKDYVGVVGQVFAGIALDLIDHNSGLDPEDNENMVLPVGAKTMSNSLDGLSKLVTATQQLFSFLIRKNIEHPAIRMVRDAFSHYEPQM